ncbi:efflux transporter outer membrane subunit [Neptunitalea lumnitzerae]|uniref:Multidrug resistance protein n=1 Tax=Neptunitalea lumnitzerae TaxID=2965509 RepID=A0ABQ5MFU3_9FLAO|nr:TolC family protein [Neptunitalea sp. Y10]GLB48291.1 multidrug resistance protein [Neptunitalea sp. Y10]
MKFIKHKNIMIRTALIAVLAITLQSCFVAKNYDRPEFEETEHLFRTDSLPTDSVSMAEVSWKEIFTDQYLVGYIEKGLQNNIDIRVAIQQMNAAQAYLKQGKSGYFPTLSAGATVTHQNLSKNSQFGSFFNGSIDQYELSGDLSWEADIWGKIRSNKRASEASYLQSVAAHKAVKTALVSQIAATYYTLLSLDEQLRITEQTVATRKQSVETIKALKEAGQQNQVAVDQTTAQLYSAQALVIDLKNSIFQAENTLAILLGETPQGYERASLADEKINTELKIGVPTSLLRNRPDVMAAEYGLINSFELTNVAKSNFYPSLTLTANSGLQSLTFDNWFSGSSFFATLVGGLTQPIFNQRQIKTQYEVAQAQQEQSLLNFKQTLLTAGKEVSEALYTYDAEVEKYEYLDLQVQALQNAETNSEELLDNGYATYLDLLTARESRLSAELNLIDSKLQQLLAVVNLYEALGGGWQ